MRVKVISRSEEEFTRERNQDLQKTFRNLDPTLHPLERAHEYVRALNAAKLDRVFAKPFVGALTGHRDGISCMAKSPSKLSCLLSGSHDGDIRMWDMAYRRTVRIFPGHKGAVRGLAISGDGDLAASCGDDCTVRLWQLPDLEIGDAGGEDEEEEPLVVLQGKNAFRAVDHQWRGRLLATAGAQVDIWDPERSEPVSRYSWGADSVISVRFNPAERDLLASTGSDRSVALYDLRADAPVRKVVMQTKANAVAWNPREPLSFTVANEDCSCYSYDMRRLATATCVHKDHVAAVMDLDFSPTGREFVTASYDRSVRIFAYNGGHSREVYTTKRMQRVFAVKYSLDSTYVISGSDDTNIRLWKANASEQLGVRLPREKAKSAYLAKVKERYKHLPEIKRIDRHRHLPVGLFKAGKLRRTMEGAERKKEERRRAHSKPGAPGQKSAKTRKIVAVVE